jgi:phage terminase small subunit
MSKHSRYELFVKEYLVDRNASRAYRVFKPGCGVKTAGTEGHKLLKKPEIRDAIEAGLRKQIQDAEARAAAKGFTRDRWLEELQAIALANIDDVITIEGEAQYRGRKGNTVFFAKAVPKLTTNRARQIGATIKKISESKNGIAIEMHSKQSALVTLGQAYGWLKNDDAPPPPSSVNVVFEMPSNGREVKMEKK